MSSGWKTVIIEKEASLSYSQGCLLAQGEFNACIPLDQLQTLLVVTLRVRVSAYLLNELQLRGIKVIFCDHRHSPGCELLPYYGNGLQSGCLYKQLDWSKAEKARMWAKLVRSKLSSQLALLEHLGREIPSQLPAYLSQVQDNDRTNREGQAARLYFTSLFGASFIRGSDTPANGALNYGYTVLLSSVNRLVVCAGYLTNLGIGHHSIRNPYNLSCDLMEPFRPFVDALVCVQPDRELDTEYRHELVAFSYRYIRCGGSRMLLQTALEQHVQQTLKGMTEPGYVPERLEFI